MIHAKVIVMKISNSKKELARIISENGGWRNGYSFSAQDGDGTGSIGFLKSKPQYYPNIKFWRGVYDPSERIARADVTIKNFHQTILSREEYFHLYPAPDADGWIEWEGVPRSPVSKGTQVDVKMQNGTQHFGQLIDDECWSDCWGDANIIAYRLHKPEQVETVEYNYSGVVYTGPVKSEFVVNEKPTIDQLLQDWRNADDFAQRKQAEADEAAAMRDERWQAVQDRAGEVGVTVGPCESVAAEPEQVNPVKPVMTGKFRNAKIGSPKHYISNKGWADEICDECGKRFWSHFDTDCNSQ